MKTALLYQVILTMAVLFHLHASLSYAAPSISIVEQKYVTRWRWTHTLLSDRQYCVPFGSGNIYSGKDYKWAIKPVHRTKLRIQPGNITFFTETDIPESAWDHTAVWWIDANTADCSRPHDTTMSLESTTSAPTPHNIHGRAELGSTEYTFPLTLAFSAGYQIGAVVLGFNVAAQFPITIGAGRIFSDEDAAEELQVYKFCQCPSCMDASGNHTCLNNICNGGCRGVYEGVNCNVCMPYNCCFSPNCPYYETALANDCTCEYGYCGCEHHMVICSVHQLGCNYCDPQAALAPLRLPYSRRTLIATDPGWMGKVRAAIEYVAHLIKT